MKTLLLLRHAEAVDQQDNDHERELTEKGRQQSQKVSQTLRQKNLTPSLIISSSSKRTRQTTALVIGELGYKGRVEYSEDLYINHPQKYIDAVHHYATDENVLMLVGHNPTLEDLLRNFVGKLYPMGKCALAVVNVPITDWKELSLQTRGTLG